MDESYDAEDIVHEKEQQLTHSTCITQKIILYLYSLLSCVDYL